MWSRTSKNSGSTFDCASLENEPVRRAAASGTPLATAGAFGAGGAFEAVAQPIGDWTAASKASRDRLRMVAVRVMTALYMLLLGVRRLCRLPASRRRFCRPIALLETSR